MKKILISLILLVLVLTNTLFTNVLAVQQNNGDEETLLKYYDVFNNSQYSMYALYDIDKNGFPELILTTDMDRPAECHIYTYTNSRIVDLGTQYAQYGIYGIDENGILISGGGTGVVAYNKLYIDNNMLKEDKTAYLSACVQPGFEEYLYKGNRISETQFAELENSLSAIEFNNIYKLQAPIKVILNGAELSFDQPPILDPAGRVMVPIRAIFEALGYNIEWYGDTQTAVAYKGNNTITVQINNPVISYNRGTYLCDVSPQIVSGRTLVPVRAISECAGCNVDWNGQMKTVVITSNDEGNSSMDMGEGEEDLVG